MSHPIFGRRRFFFLLPLFLFLLFSTAVFAAEYEYTYDHMQSMIPATSIGPDFVSVSMLQFRIKATSNNITITSLTIGSGDASTASPGVYAPNTTDRESYIKRIEIYCDATGKDNETYDEGTDPLVGSMDLGITNSKYEAILPISGVPTLISANVTGNTKAFYVFYSTGASMVPGTVVKAQLRNVGISESPALCKATLPAAYECSFVLATVNISLYSVAAALPVVPTPTFFALGGERDIPVLTFTLKTTEVLSNVSINIKNVKNSFINSGCGVDRVRIKRKDPDSTVTVVGYTSVFQGSSVAVVPIQSIPYDNGGECVYTVYYDMSPGSLANTEVAGQLANISGPGVVFNSGTLPAPLTPPSFNVVQAPISALFVTTNTQQVKAGDQFVCQLVFKHIGTEVSYTRELQIDEVRPVFYNGNINGADISYEYSYQFQRWDSDGGSSTTTQSAVLQNAQQITYNFLVTVSNPKTVGMINVDAYINYRDFGFVANKPQQIIMSRYLKSSSYISAAKNSLVGYFMNTESDADYDFSYRLPSYIASMNVQPYGVGAVKRFMNGDNVARQSKLFVTLVNEGKFYDADTLKLYLNGTQLIIVTDYTVANGIITVKNLGTKSGVLSISCASGPSLLETAYIKYYIEEEFTIKDLMAGPSPYKAADGDLYFSCQLREAATVKISVYDSAGQLIWKSETLEWGEGYNEYAWNGKLDVGGDIGRGTYVAYVVAKCTRTDSEKRQKIKFSVF